MNLTILGCLEPWKAPTTPPPRRPQSTFYLKTKTKPKQKQYKVLAGRTPLVRTLQCMCKKAEVTHIHTPKILGERRRQCQRKCRDKVQRQNTDTSNSSSALKL